MAAQFALGKSRVEALSDGVFSIAMTLLVLKLEVPEVMHHSSNEAMLQQLLALAPAFGTYVVTFLIAGGFWFLHHLTFHFVRNVDSFLVWVNLVFLMLVALLPFSAGLMSHLLIHPVSQLFYYGNQFAIAVLLNIHWQYARSRSMLGATPDLDVSIINITTISVAIAFGSCLTVAIFVPQYSWLPLALLPFAVPLLEKRKRRLARPLDSQLGSSRKL